MIKDGYIRVENLNREALERAFALACRQLHKVVNATSEQVSLRVIKQEMLNQTVQQMKENRCYPYEPAYAEPEAKMGECMEAEKIMPGIAVNARTVYMTIYPAGYLESLEDDAEEDMDEQADER